MRSFIVFIALIVAAAYAASKPDEGITLKFDTDSNLTDAKHDFAFRVSATKYHPMKSFNMLLWSSLSLNFQEEGASADAIVGLGSLPTDVCFPFALLCYGFGAAAVQVNLESFSNNLINNAVLDANFAGNVVGISALAMQEYNVDDIPVGKPIPFLMPGEKEVCKGTELSGEKGSLTGYSCLFTPKDTETNVTITYVATRKAGIIEYGYTPVSPRSFEMIIEVSNYSLSDPRNHVRMTVGLLTASGAGTVEGNANIVHRDDEEGKDDLYSAVSGYAVFGEERKEVHVEVSSGDAGFNTELLSVLQGALGTNIDTQIAKIDFPAGKTDFVYDPAVGCGSVIYKAGASTTTLSLIVAFVCVLLYLF